MTAPVPHLGDALFTENFDGYDNSVQTTYYDFGKAVFAAVNLNEANGWTGSGSDPRRANSAPTATAASRRPPDASGSTPRTAPVRSTSRTRSPTRLRRDLRARRRCCRSTSPSRT